MNIYECIINTVDYRFLTLSMRDNGRIYARINERIEKVGAWKPVSMDSPHLAHVSIYPCFRAWWNTIYGPES